MNSRSSLAEQLRDKQYRDAFVASQIRIGLPMQCRALRESRQLTQPQMAESAGMSQPRISEIERPGERKLNIETLLRLASAFDVGLQIRFVPFSKLVADEDSVDLDDFSVLPFEEDMQRLQRSEVAMQKVTFITASAARDEQIGGQQLVSGQAEKEAAKIEYHGESKGANFSGLAS